MSKKIMLLALVVASAAAFALPAAASAQELHFEKIGNFSGEGGAGTLAASGEPTITCDKGHVKGVPSAGGTTGTIELDFTGCHTSVFGFTAKCRTEGSELDNTIKNSAVYHLVTLPDGSKGILITLSAPVKIVCAGISSVTVEGSVLGTITSPACGAESKSLTVSFGATGPTQNHKTYTGATYNLTAQTSGGSKLEAGLTTAATTVESATAGKLVCT